MTILPEAARRLHDQARYHIQATVLDRTDDGWTRVRVERVFRGEPGIAVGDEVIFCVPVYRTGQRLTPDTHWINWSSWKRTTYIEAFLNGEPPRCRLATSGCARLDALSDGPAMHADPRLEAPRPAATTPAVVDDSSVAEEHAALIAARPVVIADDLAALIPSFSPDPRGERWSVLDGPRFNPDGFDEAFVCWPYRASPAVVYEYRDAAHGLCLASTFAVGRSATDAHEQFAYRIDRIRGHVKLDLMDTFDVRTFTLERTDLWSWGDESACLLLDLGDGRHRGFVCLATSGAAGVRALVAGAITVGAESIRIAMEPALGRMQPVVEWFSVK